MVVVSAASQPSYDELAALTVELRAALDAALAQVAELQAQLKQNSKNSSKPPSSDSPFVKPAPKSLRGKTGRKPGGQPGHPGSTLRQVDRPDRVVRHAAKRCGGCGAGLAKARQVGVERMQVFDIPKVTVTVTEHQVVAKRCGCGITTCGSAPAGVAASVQYGPNTAAIAIYLPGGSCPASAPPTRCPSCLAPRSRLARSRR
jgi:hypothetical protein